MSVKIDGNLLRDAREDALLSQRELAEASGVSTDTIMRLETGEGGAYGRTVRRIARALGIDYKELLEGKALARQDRASRKQITALS